MLVEVESDVPLLAALPRRRGDARYPRHAINANWYAPPDAAGKPVAVDACDKNNTELGAPGVFSKCSSERGRFGSFASPFQDLERRLGPIFFSQIRLPLNVS